MFSKCENVPVGKCLAMLWSERRISHSLCSSPINEDCVLEMSQQLDSHANSVEFWITCLKDYPSSLVAFFQKFLLSDSILPEVNLYHSKDYFGGISIDEVNRVASSLISDVSLFADSRLSNILSVCSTDDIVFYLLIFGLFGCYRYLCPVNQLQLLDIFTMICLRGFSHLDNYLRQVTYVPY